MIALVSTAVRLFGEWNYWSQLIFSISPLAIFPFLFRASSKLPALLLTGSALFASVSYEFYILHFYFINEGFHEFIKLNVGCFGHILIAFAVVFSLSYPLSRVATSLISKVNQYLCSPASGLEKQAIGEGPDRQVVPAAKS